MDVPVLRGADTSIVLPKRRVRFAVKRVLDVALATLAIVALSPLLLIVAVLILLYDGRPIFFRQTRVGRNGRSFEMIKFRSMRLGARPLTLEDRSDSFREGPCLKVRNDPRVYPFGRILRRSSIDELPQLFNVVSGSMSLVGPRPSLPSEAAAFPEGFRLRESLPQGITGLWQLEARDDPDFQRNVDLDLEYVENWTLRRDVLLLLRTPWVVLRHAVRGSAV